MITPLCDDEIVKQIKRFIYLLVVHFFHFVKVRGNTWLSWIPSDPVRTA